MQPELVILMTPFVATIANFVAQIWHGYAMLITQFGGFRRICRRYPR